MRFLVVEEAILAHNVVAETREEAVNIVRNGKSPGVYQQTVEIISALPLPEYKEGECGTLVDQRNVNGQN